MKDSFDEEIMRKALSLAQLSRTLSPPNPWVGCIIVKEGKIIGKGSTQKAGGPHAEIMALNDAGNQAEGSAAYVTLEPCSHYGRTPPCVEALIKHKISKVVIALKDPDDRVSGNGIERLKEAGIEVVLGVCEKEAYELLEPYLFQRKNKRPFVWAKCACSLDGRLAAKDNSSKWISSESARIDAQQLRRESQAILVGSSTAMADLPRLTIRDQSEQPLRVVVDSKGKLEPVGPLFDCTKSPTLIVTTELAHPSILKKWQQYGVQVEVLNSKNSQVSLLEMLKLLYTRGIIQVLCEGGGTLLTSMLNERLINRFTAYISACLLGNEGIPIFKNLNISTIEEAVKLKYLNSKVLDGTIRVDYQFYDALKQ